MKEVGVILYVPSIPDAVRLYGALLGEPAEQSDDWALWRTPAGWLALHAWGDIPSTSGAAVVLTVDDVDAWTARAQSLGFQLLEPPHQEPWGRYAVLRDPWHHPLHLWKK